MSSTPKRPGLLIVVRRWGEMIKFSHSVFALPFALMATFLAARTAYDAGQASHAYPSALQLLLIVGCMVAARSVAMTFNRIADLELDRRNPRTAGRPLVTGAITRRQASLFLFAGSAAFCGLCLLFWVLYRNPWPAILAIPVLLYLCFYSLTKRFTRWSHFVLGSAIALSPVAAWLAIHPASLGIPALLLMIAVTFWIGGFDIIYACQDIDVDRSERLHSLPSRLGPARALLIARLAHALTVLALAALIPLANLGWIYAAGVIGVALLLAYENALVRPNDFSRVNVAFFTVNGVISILLAGLTIADVLLRA